MEERMRELIERLNQAADQYYNGIEIMSNYEYDKLYDELAEMEQSGGIVYSDSPTQRAGYRVMDTLPKVTHSQPALSLDKTKDINAFPAVFNVRDHKAVVMWKLDGSTVIADYDNGSLFRVATRGNGLIGSDITHNAMFIRGLPNKISFTGKLTVRGEAVMSYSEFSRINAGLSAEEQYKNPRNLANASISLLDSREMSKREIWFHAFKLVSAEEQGSHIRRGASCSENLKWLEELGFNVVEYQLTTVDATPGQPGLIETMRQFSDRAEKYAFPVDGLVVAANDEAFAEQQPGTAHNPNKLVGYAFKWQDETMRTTLKEIIWQASRTGLLNPVAVFEPVELEGTSVSRASIHNVSYLVDMDLQPGDEISVYKANKIIPQLSENYSKRSSHSVIGEETFEQYHIPRKCPICAGPVQLLDENASGSYSAYCRNPECSAKQIGRFVHFVQRNSMNIIGLSEATIEKFVDMGFVTEFGDFWKLSRYRDQILEMEGFGEKAYNKLVSAIDKARNATFQHFITAIGIPDIGPGQAKLLYQHYLNTLAPGTDIVSVFMEECADANVSFAEINGFGKALNDVFHSWAGSHAVSSGEITRLLEQVVIEDRIVSECRENTQSVISGKTFVITGTLDLYENRDAMKARIEELGGKVTGSVTNKTHYLINNDFMSQSSKNKKAKELGVPIITERQFQEMIEGSESE